jgi:folylpolyglutamate synthase/dihydropteroate synthase
MYDRDIYFDNRKYYENMVEAYNEAKKSKIVVVAGSFYLLCEFRRVIESENRL